MMWTDPPALNDSSTSWGGGSAGFVTSDFDYQDWSTDITTVGEHTGQRGQFFASERISIPPTGQITAPFGSTLPMGHVIRASPFQPRAGVPMIVVPSQANLPGSKFNRVQSQPIAPLTSKTPDLRSTTVCTPGTKTREGLVMVREQNSQLQSIPQWSVSPLDNEFEAEDIERLKANLFSELVPDRQVESNTIAFLVHAFSSWFTRFVFDPIRIIPVVADYIRRSQSFEYETRQTLLLVCNSALSISESTDFNSAWFATLHKHLVGRVRETLGRGDIELTRGLALATMDHSHQFISTLFKIGPLASVLNVMSLYAPVFRRACMESSEELVNFSRCFTSMNIHLKYYSALDVLQSFITQRPMFFRYDLSYPSPQEETIIKSGTGTGLRWLYGIPDRLMIVLARMNTLVEDFGDNVDPETIQELEKEIKACIPIIFANETGSDPSLEISRITVQESWGMAAQVYLYMGLCGADSSDTRVIKVQNGFMRLLRGVESRRNPDSYLVLPIAILGVATTCREDQSTLFNRLWGVYECSRPETVGNDMVRILKDIWARTSERPAVWADLRTACLRITGM